MKDKGKDTTQAFEPKPEEATEYVRELSDEELEGVVGGVFIEDRSVLPGNDVPPIEAPILNPFD